MRSFVLVVVAACGSSSAGDPADARPPQHTCAASTSLPSSAPSLAVGVWTRLPDPPNVSYHGGGNDVFTQGITLDPCDAATLYLSVCSFDVENGHPGLYKSEDAGATWRQIGALDEPIHVRVDPRDPAHLYAADGVRGGTLGFWISNDGGMSWSEPPAFTALETTLFAMDVYDVGVDPNDFDHLLVTSHSPWDGFGKFNKWNQDDAGILESQDGGASWIVHEPIKGWSHGDGVWFLDDRDTWLFGSQAGGYWRTTDGGAHFTQVTAEINMQHGGGGVYRSAGGTWYAGGVPHMMKSTDGGASWTAIGPYSGFNSIIGDGTRLYSAPVGGPAFVTATEADDATWTDFPGGPSLTGGPFEMAYDRANHIVYAANWTAGLWALKTM